MKHKIILFASGKGTNVDNICSFFEQNKTVTIIGVYTNNPKAAVIDRLKSYGIQVEIFNKISFTKGTLLKKIKKQKPDLIILSGFLLKIGSDWIKSFPNKIINIHPSLLPKYGGKGMYGKYVHEAVRDQQENETGITIHYVNETYDEGKIIFQEKVTLQSEDSVDDIALKVHQLEYLHFPKVIKNLLKNLK